jgi:hypothetical protein
MFSGSINSPRSCPFGSAAKAAPYGKAVVYSAVSFS